jgi:hypothetical protein
MAAMTTRSTPLNGAFMVSNLLRLLGDQWMRWMTVVVHIARSLSQLWSLRDPARWQSRDPLVAGLFRGHSAGVVGHQGIARWQFHDTARPR